MIAPDLFTLSALPILNSGAGYDFLWSREIGNINFFELSESNGTRRKNIFIDFRKNLVHGKKKSDEGKEEENRVLGARFIASKSLLLGNRGRKRIA